MVLDLRRETRQLKSAMTTSSATKDNPKAGKKAIKQATIVSSSLKSIMKYGGGSLGQKDVNKKAPSDKNVGSEVGSKRRQWEKQSDVEVTKKGKNQEENANNTAFFEGTIEKEGSRY